MAKIIGNLVGPPNPQIDIETKLSEPRSVIYLDNGMRIEARNDGIYLCKGDKSKLLYYSAYNGIRADEASWADNANSATMANNANYATESRYADEAERAEQDADGRALKGVNIYDMGDTSETREYLEDGQILSMGVISTHLSVGHGANYQQVGYSSALYFTTPSVIPENYSQFPDDIYFKGDSTDNGAFVPEANMRYTIVFDFDGFMMNGYVSGVTTV